MLSVGGLHPLAAHPAEQVTLPHDLQHLLVIHVTPSVPQFTGNPPVAIAGIFKTGASISSLNSASASIRSGLCDFGL
jgi:hypothetical protein